MNSTDIIREFVNRTSALTDGLWVANRNRHFNITELKNQITANKMDFISLDGIPSVLDADVSQNPFVFVNISHSAVPSPP